MSRYYLDQHDQHMDDLSMDLNSIFDQAKEEPHLPLKDVQAVEQFVEDNSLSLDDFKNDNYSRDDFLDQYATQKLKQRMRYIYESVRGIASEGTLKKWAVHKSVELFLKNIDLKVPQPKNNNNGYVTVDSYLPKDKKFKDMYDLERLAAHNGKNLSHAMIEQFHKSGRQSSSDFIDNLALFSELNEADGADKYMAQKLRKMMSGYLSAYNREIAYPLPPTSEDIYGVDQFNDRWNIIMQYIAEINAGLHHLTLSTAPYPLQFDVAFVSADAAKRNSLDLYNLDGTEFENDYFLNDKLVDGIHRGINGVYKFLRTAMPKIKSNNCQRFIFLIVRKNKNDSKADSLYIIKPKYFGSIPDPAYSDHTELHFLYNSLQDIIPGHLGSQQQGVLNVNHHLHQSEDSKVYLSYGHHKGTVTKSNIFIELQKLVKNGIETEEFRTARREYKNLSNVITNNMRFANYIFGKSYETFAPRWNPTNCRAMGNVFIPKSCTNDLMQYIDEPFLDASKLYYNIDYTIGMQIVDEQTIYVHLNDGKQKLCFLNTELHKNHKCLYAVIIPNKQKSKQRWMMIEYDHISEAFMTAEEIEAKYGIFSYDLPKGSKAFHNNWQAQKDEIQITKKMIVDFFRGKGKVRVIQSKQNLGKMNVSWKAGKKYVTGRGAVKMHKHEFSQYAVDSLELMKNEDFIYIAHFQFRQNEYHLEKLLPVWLPDQRTHVALCFDFNPQRGCTQISAIGLDWIDLKNKASLIDMQTANSLMSSSFLKKMTVNNLELTNDGAKGRKNKRGPNRKGKRQSNQNYRPSNDKIANNNLLAPPPLQSAHSQSTPDHLVYAPNETRVSQNFVPQNHSVSPSPAPAFVPMQYSNSAESTMSNPMSMPPASVPINLNQLNVPVKYIGQVQYFGQYLPALAIPVQFTSQPPVQMQRQQPQYQSFDHANIYHQCQ